MWRASPQCCQIVRYAGSLITLFTDLVYHGIPSDAFLESCMCVWFLVHYPCFSVLFSCIIYYSIYKINDLKILGITNKWSGSSQLPHVLCLLRLHWVCKFSRTWDKIFFLPVKSCIIITYHIIVHLFFIVTKYIFFYSSSECGTDLLQDYIWAFFYSSSECGTDLLQDYIWAFFPSYSWFSS